jgi:SAM-dependent methyltransferase
MGVAETVSYDDIGRGYAGARRADPRIAQQIWAALGDAQTIVNVGAGTGSYEPPDRDVTAVEPSEVMRSQRPPRSARCIAAAAESLPFADQSFDAAMAVLSDHHWRDPIAGLREMRRVAKRVVVFQWDFAQIPRFWLVRDYLAEFAAPLADVRPTTVERAQAIDASMHPVPIPWDCTDGFFHSYWRRPYAYLDEQVRRGTSVWARLERVAELRAVAALDADLASGAWQERNADLLQLEEAELGARLLVADGPRRLTG